MTDSDQLTFPIMGKFVSSTLGGGADADRGLDQAEERRLRKKAQNRLNQRARRESPSTMWMLVILMLEYRK